MAVSATQPLRLVLDTNVVVAGFLWSGPPRRLIELAIEREAVELFSSAVLLDELALRLHLGACGNVSATCERRSTCMSRSDLRGIDFTSRVQG